jgi:hypothetical protein
VNSELRVELSEEDADDVRLDTLTRQFHRELRQVDGVDDVTATTAAVSAPLPGTKGLDAAAVETLLVAVGTAAQGLAAVVLMAREWRKRGSRTRKVRLEIDGDLLVLEDEPDPAEDRLISEFIKRHAKRKSRP